MHFCIVLILLACTLVTNAAESEFHRNGVNYASIGCYYDEAYVFHSLEGHDPLLNDDYKTRDNAVEKCALAANSRWRTVFAIEDGGMCVTTALSLEAFKKPDISEACTEGDYRTGLQVHVIGEINRDKPLPAVNYTSLGCYHDNPEDPALGSLEGQDPLLQDDYRTREDAIQKCALAISGSAYLSWPRLFAIQDGGQCLGGVDILRTFNKHGISEACAEDGKGGLNANHVYFIGEASAVDIPFEWSSEVGCYKDLPLRAIPSMEGTDHILDGNYTTREDAISKCNVLAQSRGYDVFALQDGGMCLAGSHRSATKYGLSRDCKKDGKGGPMANHVYAPTTAVLDYLSSVYYESLGCYKDEPSRAINSLEGQDVLLKDNYKLRKDAIQKCALLTKILGYAVFGIQDGGMCVGSASANETFNKYGVSQHCRNDGRGGPMANEVYAMRSHPWIDILNSFYYSKVGCMKSNWMESMEGKDATLDGNPAVRERATEKCGLVSLKRGYEVYTVHNGTCSGGPTAVQTFLRHGYHASDSNCLSGSARSVYVLGLTDALIHFVNYTHLGCFKALLDLVPSAEGLSFARFYHWDNYKRRESAIQKCALYAQLKHFKVFALQDGGKCLTGSKAHENLYRLDGSQECGRDGKGGKSAIDVYAVKS